MISKVGEDVPEFNPDHPIFAPMQLALSERFDRELEEVNEQLRYDDCVHALRERFIASGWRRRNNLKSFWKMLGHPCTTSSGWLLEK